MKTKMAPSVSVYRKVLIHVTLSIPSYKIQYKAVEQDSGQLRVWTLSKAPVVYWSKKVYPEYLGLVVYRNIFKRDLNCLLHKWTKSDQYKLSTVKPKNAEHWSVPIAMNQSKTIIFFITTTFIKRLMWHNQKFDLNKFEITRQVQTIHVSS